MLHRRLGKALGIQDGKLVHGLLTIMTRAATFGGDVAQCQPDQLRGRLVGREMATGFDDLAQPRSRPSSGRKRAGDLRESVVLCCALWCDLQWAPQGYIIELSSYS